MSRTNETRYIKPPETCQHKCRLDSSVCNNKQRGNEDKCRCESKELIEKVICDKGFIWSPSNCQCECNVGEYLDYRNYKCRKTFVDKLVEECHDDIDEKELYQNKTTYN